MDQPSLIAIIGPTASGKSAAAAAIAHMIGGAVIGADSRQVYRGMDLGSGKEPGHIVAQSEKRKAKNQTKGRASTLDTYYLSGGVPHYMIDIVSPRTDYNAAKYCTRAGRIMRALHDRGIMPIVCGGTHFWVQALLEGSAFAPVAPDHRLRAALADTPAATLMTRLATLDPARAAAIAAKGESANRHRLIRAIEIAQDTTLHKESQRKNALHLPHDAQRTTHNHPLIIAIVPPMDTVRAAIAVRLDTRLAAGMLAEVTTLHYDRGVSWNRLASFGLEYRWCTAYLRGEVSYGTMRDRIIVESGQFAKRQLTWIRRWQRQGTPIHLVPDSAAAIAFARTSLGL